MPHGGPKVGMTMRCAECAFYFATLAPVHRVTLPGQQGGESSKWLMAPLLYTTHVQADWVAQILQHLAVEIELGGTMGGKPRHECSVPECRLVSETRRSLAVTARRLCVVRTPTSWCSA